MALHSSLVELAHQAPRLDVPAAARGVLAEAQELLRNALLHREDEVELAAWFSRLIIDVVRSPAVSSPVLLTGAVARGDALPTIPVTWIGEDPNLGQLLRSADLDGHSVDESSVARRVDAGLRVGAGGEEALLAEALQKRPPAVTLIDGLPDRNAPVDIQAHLLSPIAAIARWAAPAPRPTLDRISIAVERGLFRASEGEVLSAAWQTGMSIEARRWMDHATNRECRFDSLPALHRTAYGAASRGVAATFTAIAARECAAD
ncbi:MAG: hypothetical protein SOW59_04820 [Corynebacterium sp.]|nr:hypothetical protein [Corynebacterium sp.]